MPSEFVERCLTAFNVVAQTLPAHRITPNHRRLCQLVATALEERRHSAIRTAEGLGARLASLVPALLHDGDVIILVPSERQLDDRFNEVRLLQQPARELFTQGILLQPESVETLTRNPSHFLSRFLETGRRELTKSELREYDEWNKHRTFDRDPKQNYGVLIMPQSLYIQSCVSDYFSGLLHDAVVIDDPQGFTSFLSKAAAYGREIDELANRTYYRPNETPPTSELQGQLNDAVASSRNLLMPLLVAEEYATLDPCATWGLKHGPDLGDWLVRALTRHCSLILRLALAKLSPSSRAARLNLLEALESTLQRTQALCLELDQIQGRPIVRPRDEAQLRPLIVSAKRMTEASQEQLLAALGQVAYEALDPFQQANAFYPARALSWIQDTLWSLDEGTRRMGRSFDRNSRQDSASASRVRSCLALRSLGRSLRGRIAVEIARASSRVDGSSLSTIGSEPDDELFSQWQLVERSAVQTIEDNREVTAIEEPGWVWIQSALGAQLRWQSTMTEVARCHNLDPLHHRDADQIMRVVGTGILHLRLIETTYSELETIGYTAGPATHLARLTGTASEPELQFFPEDVARETKIELHLPSYFRTIREPSINEFPSGGGRPIIVSPDITPELTTRLGAYDRDLPYVVD